MKNYIAYYAANNEFEYFDTEIDAKKWLDDYYDDDAQNDGFSQDTLYGDDFIAKIIARSKFVETDRKENYHEHTDNCPEGCDKEEWPYYDYENVGNIILEPAEE